MSAHRLRWENVPAHVRAAIESTLHARVVTSTSGPGGYSPSFASRCELADGRRVFVKAVSPAQNPQSPGMLRSEIEVTRALPRSVAAPRLLHTLDDGEWVVAIFEYIDGRAPGAPWTPEDVARVFAAIRELGVTPITESLRALPTAEDRLASVFQGWATIANHPTPLALDEWAAAHVDDLVTLEERWSDAVRGNALLHFDIRSDNTLIESGGRVVFVDWPHGCIGASWLDVVLMIPSLVIERGGDAETLVRDVAADAEPGAIDSVLAAIAGTFTWGATLPDPPGLPTLRAFQRAQAEVALRWLRTRLGDPAQQ
jgi:hypothetical protein